MKLSNYCTVWWLFIDIYCMRWVKITLGVRNMQFSYSNNFPYMQEIYCRDPAHIHYKLLFVINYSLLLTLEGCCNHFMCLWTVSQIKRPDLTQKGWHFYMYMSLCTFHSFHTMRKVFIDSFLTWSSIHTFNIPKFDSPVIGSWRNNFPIWWKAAVCYISSWNTHVHKWWEICL